ncbi:MAG: hypothetical protein WA746_26435 [Isosphaeraceae bacterium]|jgi:hypothetical protein
MTLIQINDTIINLDRVEKITFVPCGRHPGDERDSPAGPILYIDFQPVRDIDGRNYVMCRDEWATAAWDVIRGHALIVPRPDQARPQRHEATATED